MELPDFRLDTTFESAGEWWLSSNPLKRVHGRVKYSPQSGMSLECAALLPIGFGPGPPAQTIHGQLEYSGPATLFDSHGSSVSYGARVQTQTFSSSSLLVGMHAESFDTLVNGAEISIDNLNDWVSSGPFNSDGMEVGGEGSTVLRYRYDVDMRPSPDYEVPSIRANVSIASNLSSVGSGHSTKLSQDRIVRVRLQNARPLREVIGIAQNLELLFSLLTGGASLLQSVVVFGTPFDTLEREPRLHFLYNRVWRRGGRRLFHRTQMPACFEEVTDNFDVILNGWFDICDKYSPVTKLLTSSLFQPGPMFIENRFLTVAQAIEGYCRLAKSETHLSRDEFKPIKKAMKKCLPDSLPERFRTLAEDRIGRMPEFSLKDRLLSLFERNEWLKWTLMSDRYRKPGLDEIEEFVGMVVKIRNGLTHVDADRAKNATVDFSIFWRLRAVLCLMLLFDAGVPLQKRLKELQTEGNYIMWWMDEAFL